MEKNYYEILEIDKNASQEIIEKASLLMDHNNFNASSSTKTEEIIKEIIDIKEHFFC